MNESVPIFYIGHSENGVPFSIKKFQEEKNMKNSTALGANSETTRTITFKSVAHKNFYLEYLSQCRYKDVYHKALVYCLGIDADTRNHVNRIYDFKSGCVKTECLNEGWQTSGSMRIVRMAFNLYCNSKLTHITYEARTTSKEFSNAVKNIQREVWHNLVEKDSEVKNNFQQEQYIKMDDTIKYLIESADTIDAMCFAKREVKRSNMEFVPILKRQTKKLQELKMKYPCIEYFETYILRELLRTI